MTRKLVDLSVQLSFEKMVYTGYGSLAINALLFTVGICLHFLLFNVLSQNIGWLFFVFLTVIISALIALYIIGNKYTKENLNVPLLRWNKNPSSEYRALAKSRLILMFMDSESDFYGLTLNEAEKNLRDEYNRRYSEMRKIYLVFTGAVAVVWIQFISKLFSYIDKNNLEEAFLLLGVLLLFCVAIAALYFFIRNIFLITSKLGKINDLISLMEECRTEIELEIRK